MKYSKVITTLLASLLLISACGKDGNASNEGVSSLESVENYSSSTLSDDSSNSSSNESQDSNSSEEQPTLYSINYTNNDLVSIELQGITNNKCEYDTPVAFKVVPSSSEVVVNAVSVTDDNSNSVQLNRNPGSLDYAFYMPQSNVTISVDAALKEYNISFEKPDAVSIQLFDIQNNKAKANDSVSFQVVLDSEDFEIEKVSVMAKENEITTSYADNKYSFTMPSSDVTIKVTTISNKHTITTQNSNHVRFSLIGQKEEFKEGDEVMFNASADYGYALNSVTASTSSGAPIDLVKSSYYTFIMPNENVVISFETEQLYTVTTTGDDNVSITIDGEKDYYKAGSTISFSLSFQNKYELNSLSIKSNDNDVSYTEQDGVYSFTMSKADVKITATSKKIETSTVEPFPTKTTYEGEWSYYDGTYDYTMRLRIVFNGNGTLSWYLTYESVDDGWDDYYDWLFQPDFAVKPTDMQGDDLRDGEENVEYEYDQTKDQINYVSKVNSSKVDATLQLVRTGESISSIYMTKDLSSGYYQTGNRTLNKK